MGEMTCLVSKYVIHKERKWVVELMKWDWPRICNTEAGWWVHKGLLNIIISIRVCMFKLW